MPINIIQAYAPTTQSDDNEIERVYEQMDMARRQCKNNEETMVVGDLNAKVGRGRCWVVDGGFGLGMRNERGDK